MMESDGDCAPVLLPPPMMWITHPCISTKVYGEYGEYGEYEGYRDARGEWGMLEGGLGEWWASLRITLPSSALQDSHRA